MDEAEVIERVALVADDQPTEVAQPGEEPLDLPTATEAAERPSIRVSRRAFAPVSASAMAASGESAPPAANVADQGRRLGDPLQAYPKAPRALNQPAVADLVEPCHTCGAGHRVGIVVWGTRVW